MGFNPSAAVEQSRQTISSRSDDGTIATPSAANVMRVVVSTHSITTHPDGHTWAGASSNYLALIHLEGGNNS